jgi:hypothetical protein
MYQLIPIIHFLKLISIVLTMKPLFYLIFLLIVFSCQSSEQKPAETPATSTATAPTPPPPAPQKTEEATGKDSVSEASLQANQFKSILMQMSSIGYELKNYKELPADKTNINLAINLAVRDGKYTTAPIDMTGVRILKRAFIKRTKPTSAGADNYPRADIEAWECTSEAIAKEKIAALNKLKKEIPWEVISKDPIIYWQDGHHVVLLTPAAMDLLDEMPRIKKYLESKM